MNVNRLDYIQKAKELTGSTDMAVLIKAAKELEEYIDNGYEAVGIPSSLVSFLPYTKINHLFRGAMPFRPFPFQEDLAIRLQNHIQKPNGTLMHCTARQMGASSVLQCFALWFALSTSDQKVLFLVNRAAVGKNVIDSIVYSAMDLPYTFGGIEKKTYPTLTLSNHSEIIFKTMNSSKALAGLINVEETEEKPNLIIMMDAAYLPFAYDDEFETTFDAIDKEIPVVMSSCLNTRQGLFYKKLMAANASNKIINSWRNHPHRDEAWKQGYLNMIGEDKFAQEFECKFKDE